MTKRRLERCRSWTAVCGLLLILDAPMALMGEPSPAAVSAFDAYSRAVESRLARQHQSGTAFLAADGMDEKGADLRLRQGGLRIERVAEPGTRGASGDFPGALLHHWRGTAFAAGAKAEDFERLMRDFSEYPRHFAPQVLAGKGIAQGGGRIQAWMRIRQRHVITVVMDATYDVAFGQLDRSHGYSLSQSTRIAEIGSPGTRDEHALSGDEEHGFLWRLNTYWSYEERDGGLYLQVEAVSLSRSIPAGLGWAIGPYVESIPRESLEFTLRSACVALRK